MPVSCCAATVLTRNGIGQLPALIVIVKNKSDCYNSKQQYARNHTPV